MSWELNQPPDSSGPQYPSQKSYPSEQPETPGYQRDSPYGYTPQRPRPPGQAIQELPTQYVKVLTKPGAQPFLEEQSKADWGVIWVQLLFLGLL
ncbi:MAG: hypothetical protein ACRDHW_14915, partial [Ktedonobacteraceae bacterium]